MPKPRVFSKVHMPPRVKGFNPMGYYRKNIDPVKLTIDEYEVIRLLDYEGLAQSEAATIMGVSRPSVTRIYQKARVKMATMLTEARQLSIEGGRVFFDSSWYCCESCDSKFNAPLGKQFECCVLCGASTIYNLEE
ncbi:MAG TPA: DUF134 domain-containing protein [Prolixibacteraceae bacterium]|nr:DUF134 domain-containing protein [Prolixibacteraceae bacterium]HPR59926.1 DUF134 domain-containing protein [Prolixibacteraceae bacterium]